MRIILVHLPKTAHGDVSSFLVRMLAQAAILAVHPGDHVEHAQCRYLFRQAGLLPDRLQPAMQRPVVRPQHLPDRVQMCACGAQDLTDDGVRRSGTAGDVCGQSAWLPSPGRSPAAPAGRFPGPRRAIRRSAGPVRRPGSRSGPIAVRSTFRESPGPPWAESARTRTSPRPGHPR